MIEKAELYYRIGNYPEAEIICKRIIDKYKSTPIADAEPLQDSAAKAYYILGAINFKRFRDKASREDLKGALALGEYKACFLLGKMAYDEGDLELALNYWRKGTEQGDELCADAYNDHYRDSIESDIYEGETDEDGLPHGLGKMDYAHTAHSNWLGYSVAPKRYVGQWYHGVKCGEGKMFYFIEGGYEKMTYFGRWADDLPNGRGEVRVERPKGDDNSHLHEFVGGKREGWGVEIVDGVEIGCTWKADRKNGRGICSMGYQKSFRGEWVDDVLIPESVTPVTTK